MFQLTIATPEKVIFTGESTYLSLITDEGEEVILPNHAPYISRVHPGILRYMKDGKTQEYAISEGFLYVKEGETDVLLDEVIHPRDIDLQRAQEAKERAEALIKEIDNNVEIMRLKAQIKLANLHIATAKKFKTTTPHPNNIPE